jgi:hypothetical protein
MTTLIEQPDETVQPEQQPDRRLRTLTFVVVVLAVVSLLLAGLAVVLVTGDDDATTMPADVQQVLDDFEAAIENNDYEAFSALVTEDFRRTEYWADTSGDAPFRGEQNLDNFRSRLSGGMDFDIEESVEPIVVGDGPWFASVPQVWTHEASHTYYENMYTYVIVDVDGTLLVDDGYWAGIGPILIED